MTGTKEEGYILAFDVYDGRETQVEEFSNMEKLKTRLDEISEKTKHNIIWYNIYQRVEAGTYTEDSYTHWWKSKNKHNIPERRIGNKRLRL